MARVQLKENPQVASPRKEMQQLKAAFVETGKGEKSEQFQDEQGCESPPRKRLYDLDALPGQKSTQSNSCWTVEQRETRSPADSVRNVRAPFNP